jgi:hypothetical protein
MLPLHTAGRYTRYDGRTVLNGIRFTNNFLKLHPFVENIGRRGFFRQHVHVLLLPHEELTLKRKS